ncbi:MAG: hypothetical protein E7295_08670 [Lachnospiraceae bacterium]|nr:hypothetical protein [Lachnospiraceae bacterium]
MKMRSILPMKIAKSGYVIMSLAFCLIGILFMTRPQASAVLIGRALGIVMIVFGVIKLIGYFSKDLFRLAFQYDLEIGILLLLLGVIAVTETIDVMNFIFIAVGVVIMVDALFKTRIAFDSKAFGIGTWWTILVLAVMTGLIGLVLVFRPWESASLLTILLGVALFAEGILNLCVAVCTVKIVKNQYPDVIDTSYKEE